MSSGGQIGGAVVGGIVGFVVTGGNPAGALKGATYGAAIGGALDPPPGPKLDGPRISDKAEQTSSYGVGVASINGKIGVKGSVIWVEGGKKKIITTEEENEGGKGGGDAGTTEVQKAVVTCAILLTDHEVDGIARLWFGPNLVANGISSDAATATASGDLFPTLHLQADKTLVKASLSTNPAGGTVRLYPGYDDQPCDPRMSADLGAGNCPAYRGYTLLFLYDFPLEEYNNSIAGLQVKAELIKGGSNDTPVLLSTQIEDRPTTPSYPNHANSPYHANGTAYVYASHDAAPPPYPTYIYKMGLESEPRVRFSKTSDGYGEGWSDVPGSVDSHPLAEFPLFNASAGFGRFYKKDDITYGYDLISPWKIYKGLDSVVYGTSLAIVVVDDSGNVYAINASEIKKYDEDLNYVSSISVSFGTDIFSNACRAMLDSSTGLIWVQTWGAPPNGNDQHYYAIAFDEDYQSSAIIIEEDSYTSPFDTHNFSVSNGLLTRFRYRSSPDYDINVENWRLPSVDSDGQPLPEVVREYMERSALIEPADIDVTLLTGNVRYKKVGVTALRSVIAPLMAGYNFDVIESGYQLKCIPRGQSPVMTIDYNDLDARPFGAASGVAIDQQREMDSQLPKQVLLDYIDAGRNYNQNQESSIERIGSQSVNIESFELALVFTPDEAAQQAQTSHDRRWLERDDFAFVLPQTYNRLESTDVVTLPTPYANYEFRLTSINYLADGRLACTAKLNDSAVYIQPSEGGTRIVGDTTVPFAGSSIMHLLDIPLIRDEDNKPGFGGALSGKFASWPGGVITRSVDSGQTWKSIQGFKSGVTAGVCLNSLPAHDGYVIDRANSLTITMYSSDMTLSSITQEQMLTGKHWFAYGVDGRWEIGQFANATLNADGTYTIDTLVRGAKGTEQHTSTHEDGDLFIFLADADAAFVAANVSDIGVERLYRGVTSKQSINAVADTSFTYSGINLEPLSPVQLAGSIDGSDNWDLTWLRRSRLTSSWWTTGVDAPIGEDSEIYEIDIMSGATVVRTLTATSESVQYTSANQVTDWGGNQTTLTFRVYQLSATVGRGYVAEITL